MELIIFGISLLAIAAFLFAVALNTMARIEEEVQDNKVLIAELSERITGVRNEIDDIKRPPAHVSDPFKKPKEIYQSTKHIVVPKTPDEIRAENFEKIKEGQEYGSPS